MNTISSQASDLKVWIPTASVEGSWLYNLVDGDGATITSTHSWEDDTTLGQVLDVTGGYSRFTDRYTTIGDMSFAAWVWCDNWTDNLHNTFISFGTHGNKTLLFGKTDDSFTASEDNCLKFTYNDGAWRNVVCPSSQLGSNEFHHIAIVVRRSLGSQVDFYVDGSLVSTIVDENGLNYSLGNGPMVVAANGSFGEKLTGRIADIRLYHRVLSSADVAALYNEATRWELYKPFDGVIFNTLSRGGFQDGFSRIGFRSRDLPGRLPQDAMAYSGSYRFRTGAYGDIRTLFNGQSGYSGRVVFTIPGEGVELRPPFTSAYSSWVKFPPETPPARPPFTSAFSGPVRYWPPLTNGKVSVASAYSGPVLFPEGEMHTATGTANIQAVGSGKLFKPQRTLVPPDRILFFMGKNSERHVASVFTSGQATITKIVQISGTASVSTNGNASSMSIIHGGAGTVSCNTEGVATLVATRFVQGSGQAGVSTNGISTMNVGAKATGTTAIATVGTAVLSSISLVGLNGASIVSAGLANLESPIRFGPGQSDITTSGDLELTVTRFVRGVGTAAIQTIGDSSISKSVQGVGTATVQSEGTAVFAGSILAEGQSSVQSSGMGSQLSRLTHGVGQANIATLSDHSILSRLTHAQGTADIESSSETDLIATRFVHGLGNTDIVSSTDVTMNVGAKATGTAAIATYANDGFTRDEVDLPGVVRAFAIVDTMVLDNDDHWNAWSGYRRVHGNTMRLAFSDMSTHPLITTSNRLMHFRWGTNQNHNSLPSGYGTTYSTGTRSVNLTASGVQASSGTGNAFIEPPGTASSYQFLFENPESAAPVPPSPPGAYDSCFISMWATLNPSTTRTLIGGRMTGDTDLVGYDRPMSTFALTAVTDTTSGVFLLELHTRTGDGEETYFQSVATMLSTSLRHYLVHTFFTRTETQKWWHCRWFMNGFYQKEDAVRLDTGGNEMAVTHQGAVRAWMQSAPKPVILAERQSAYPWTLASPWGGSTYINQSTDEIDELIVARCHPILDDGDPILSQSWTAGEEIFRPRRHPTPGVDATYGGWDITANEFIMRSPVWFVGHGAGAGIYKVRIDFNKPSPALGQSVAVSIRGSNTPYTQDSTDNEWSEWAVIDDVENGEEVDVDGGGFGNYVQIRLRLIPSTTGAVSPEITRVQYWARFNDNSEGYEDLPAMCEIGSYADLGGRVLVQKTGEVDLPARVGAVYPGIPIDLDARAFVYQKIDIDLPAKFFQNFYTVDLPARVNTFNPFEPGHADLPAHVVVQEIGLDLPARVQIATSTDLAAKVNVGMSFLGARVGVQKPGGEFLPAKLTVPAEVPGNTSPVTASVLAATWQITSSVRFWWNPATWVSSPILAYYWTVTSSNVPPEPNISWNDTPLLTTLVDMTTYGAGKRWFWVAARNTIDEFGPPSGFNVWWNNVPTQPGTSFMRVNGLNSLSQVPLVASTTTPVLSWSPSTDPDGDVVTYEIQVAIQPDFANIGGTSTSSIVSSATSVPTATWDLTPIPQPAICYWRVRAKDGEQSSEWGPVATFRLNHPPTRPTGLQAIAGI
jgi:hypothetical protein